MTAAETGGAPEPLIEARGMTVRAGGSDLLRDVDLQVFPSEIVTLVGPNGAGKTTLVRALLGLIRLHAGSVIRRAGLRLGYVPQRVQVDGALPLTVGRFLALGRATDREGIAARLEEVGAANLPERMLAGLSGGELQRVLLARALLREPELLILDEPVAGVDVGGQFHLYDLIAAIRDRRGCGVLLVSHDLHMVMASTDRVVCVNGHICCSGHPEQVARDPAYTELFGPRAAAGLARYTHAHDHTHEGSRPAGDAPG